MQPSPAADDSAYKAVVGSQGLVAVNDALKLPVTKSQGFGRFYRWSGHFEQGIMKRSTIGALS
jgi:hypothetical protein